METIQKDSKEQPQAGKLYRIIVVSSATTEAVYFDGKLTVTGNELDGITIANLAEDRGLVHGQYFILVVGLPVDYPIKPELTEEDYIAFGLQETY